MTASKKTWSDLSPAQQKTIVAMGVIEVVMTTAALRDLRRRPAGEVRGPKWAWALGSMVQPIGPLAYLTLGRRT